MLTLGDAPSNLGRLLNEATPSASTKGGKRDGTGRPGSVQGVLQLPPGALRIASTSACDNAWAT